MPIFLIHGWGTNPTIWPEWLLIENAYTYQSPDYPNYSKLVHTFLEQYQKHGQKITLIGWSLGGMLALQLAAEHPDKINKIILISSTPRFTTTENYSAGLAPSIVKNLARKLTKNKWQTQLDFYQLMFSNEEQESWRSFLMQLSPLLENITLFSLQEGLTYLLETDLRSLLPSIQTPCHIFHGTEDTICPPAACEYLASQLPHSHITWLSGAGHIPFYTQKEYCQSQLLNIINSI